MSIQGRLMSKAGGGSRGRGMNDGVGVGVGGDELLYIYICRMIDGVKRSLIV